jgi:uncharacterized delta-60 repeat protein
MSTKSTSQLPARSIAFIDSQVEDYQILVAGVTPGTEAVVIDSRADGVAQITQVLTNRTKIDSIHIVSHGSPGCLQLGKTQLCSRNLEIYRKQLRQWRHALNLDADILIYGCNVAAEIASESINSEANSTSELDSFETSADSAHLLQRIAALTGANIAASTNLTGSAAQGGDWELEYTTEDISASLAFKPETLAAYDRVLSKYTLYDGITNISTPSYYGSGYGYGIGVFQLPENAPPEIGSQQLLRLRYLQTPDPNSTNPPTLNTGAFSPNISINTASISGGNTGIAGYSNQDIFLPPQPPYDPNIGNVPQLGRLDRFNGYTLLFNVAITAETSEANRSGFSVIAPGVELGFKSTGIFAQSTPTTNNFVPAETATLPAGFNLASFNKYALNVKNNEYKLFVNDSSTPILTGPLRDYLFQPTASSPIFNPYVDSYGYGSVFLGDSNDQGSSTFRLGKVTTGNGPIVTQPDRAAITVAPLDPYNLPPNVNPRSVAINVLANDLGGVKPLKVNNVSQLEIYPGYIPPTDPYNYGFVTPTQNYGYAAINDWIYVGGKFTEIAGKPRNNIARLNSDGTLDPTFNPNATGYPNLYSPGSYDPQQFPVVSDIEIGDDGNPIVSGNFINIGGLDRRNLVRLNTTDGKVDPTFNSSNPNNPYGTPSNIYGERVGNRFAIDANGNLIWPKNDISPGINVARLNAYNGSIDPSFINENNQGDGFGAIAIDANNNPVIGGSFTQIGGRQRNNIARLNSDGTVDTTFDPNIIAYPRVEGIAIDANGKLLVNGQFSSVGGQPIAYDPVIGFMAINGQPINPYLIRLNSDGTLDTTFNPSLPSSSTSRIAVDGNGKIVVADQNRIVRLNSDGTEDPTLTNNYLPYSGYGAAIAIDSKNNIIFASNANPGGEPSTKIGRIWGSNNSNYGYYPPYSDPYNDPFNNPFNNPNALNINGSVSDIEIDPKRSITYTPAPGFNDIDFFYYSATDGYTNSYDYQPGYFYQNIPQYNRSRVTVLVNDSPVLDNSGAPYLTATQPDNPNNSGTLISELIDRLGGTKITDPNDAISLRPRGIAITDLNTTNGRWQYTADGTNWIDFAFPTDPGIDRNPLLLPSDATTRIRFIPNNGYTGNISNAITFRAWDQIRTLDRLGNITYPSASPANVDIAKDLEINGVSSPFSSAVETASITVSNEPIITNISSTEANGTYGIGKVIPITVTLSQPVTVTGTPQLILETGTTDAVANYVSGSGSNTLTFNYTVAAGNNSLDLDYGSTTSLTLNGGTILNAKNDNAVLTLPSPGAANSLGANKAIVIDTIAPTVTVNQAATQTDPTGNSTINFTVTFSEEVTGFDASDISFTGSAAAGTLTANISGTGPTYTLGVSGMTGDGNIVASINANAVTDLAGNANTASTSTDNTVTYTAALPPTPTPPAPTPTPTGTPAPTPTGTPAPTPTGTPTPTPTGTPAPTPTGTPAPTPTGTPAPTPTGTPAPTPTETPAPTPTETPAPTPTGTPAPTPTETPAPTPTETPAPTPTGTPAPTPTGTPAPTPTGTPAPTPTGTPAPTPTPNINHPPVLNYGPDTTPWHYRNLRVSNSSQFEYTFPQNTFTDSDPGDTLTYSATLSNGNPLPSWLNFNPNTRTFSGKSSNLQAFEIKLTATDKAGATAIDLIPVSITSRGVIIDAYIAGANVFLDSNKNSILDANEPSTTTDANGEYELDIPIETFDTNKNGQIDPEEGNITAVGGFDTATGLPLETPVSAPPDSTVVTLLTTLVADLMQQGISQNEAESKVKTALAIPASVDLTDLDPIVSTKDNLPGGVETLAAMVKVQNLITQTATFIDGAATASFPAINKAVVSAITSQIQSGSELDLTNPAQLSTIIEKAVTNTKQVDSNLNSQQLLLIAPQVAEVMVEANQKVDRAISNFLPDWIPGEVARVQKVALSDTAIDLKQVAAGIKPIAEVVAENTSTALDAKIQGIAAPEEPATPIATGDIVPVSDSIEDSVNSAIGTNEDDTLIGGNANDFISGKRGNDSIDGSLGDDSVYGGKGNDTLLGSNGEDILLGDRGFDSIIGGDGNDTLYGGKGNDTLIGGLGNDCLIGGAGSDYFLLSANSGIDTIVDFEDGKDAIFLTNGLTFAQLDVSQSNDVTSIKLASNGQVLASLIGVPVGAIDATDFLF